MLRNIGTTASSFMTKQLRHQRDQALERWRSAVKQRPGQAIAYLGITGLITYLLTDVAYEMGGRGLVLSMYFALALATVQGYILDHPLTCFSIGLACLIGPELTKAVLQDAEVNAASGGIGAVGGILVVGIVYYLGNRFLASMKTGQWTWGIEFMKPFYDRATEFMKTHRWPRT